TRLFPVAVTGMDSNVTALDTDFRYSCFIKSKELYCTGLSGNLKIGVLNTPWLEPTKMSGFGTEVTSFQGSTGTACAIDDGGVFCWGNNFAQRLGIVNPDPNNTQIDTP